jgi:hypothetical protein
MEPSELARIILEAVATNQDEVSRCPLSLEKSPPPDEVR